MLVEFQRVAAVATNPSLSGEDDGLPEQQEATPLPIAVNPQYVAAITPSTQMPDVTIIKLSDGRGYSVRGNYATVKGQLEAQGGGHSLN